MDKQNIWQVAILEDSVVQALNLSYKAGTPILIGDKNIEHMISEHPDHYVKYGEKIADIISSPTYLAKHPSKDSIEYIKVFKDEDGEHVLVAVRATGSGVLFARTLFIMTDEKIDKYRKNGAFIEL